MKTYQATTLPVIKADPMTRGEYNVFRHWELPEGENPDDKGYIVVDPARTKNTEKYDHGVFWIEEKAFNDQYGIAVTEGNRLNNELNHLRSNNMILSAYIQSKVDAGKSEYLDTDIARVKLQQSLVLEKLISLQYAYSEPCDVCEYGAFPAFVVEDKLNFVTAMEFCKLGYPILREGWNGKDIYVFLTENVELKPTNDKKQLGKNKLNPFTCLARLGGDANAWVASPSDIQANDWIVLSKF